MRKFIPNKFLKSKSAEKSFGFRRVTNITVLIVSLGLLFAACGEDPAGPDEDIDDEPDPVEVEASFTMEPEDPITGDEVTLDASSSSVSNNGDLSYSWALTPPDDSSVTLANTDEVNTSFTPDIAGNYDIELSVSAEGKTDDTSGIAEVTAEEEISSDITEDRTLSSKVTYIVTDEINITAELTIEPGTEIYFESGTGFVLPEINGVLIANGTEEEPILFSATNEQPGWWNGIYIRSSANQNNILDWVTVEYGGGEDFYRSGEGNVVVGRRDRDSSIDITNSTIRHSESYGLWVHYDSDLPVFEGNTVTNNGDAPVYMSASNIHQLDATSSFTGNNSDHVWVRSGGNHAINDDDVTWENLDVDYRIRGGTHVEITDGATLTIDPGTTLEFESGGYILLDEHGGLVADGTEAEPILFTGTDDQPGWWNGIYVRSSMNQNNLLNWVTIEYGGGEDFYRSGEGNVVIGRRDRDSSIDITNSTIRHSESYGLWVHYDSDLPVFEGNTVTNNGNAPVYMSASNIHQLDATSSFTGNNSDHVWVRSGGNHTINDDDVTWENLDVDYRIRGGTRVEITDGATLTIDPGATLKFESDSYIRLSDHGGLVADGTEAEPILFTGTDDQPGWWNGIYVHSSMNQNNLLNWVTVEYGGGDEHYRSGEGNVIVGRRDRDSSIDITNSTLRHSESYGLWVRSDGTVNDDACDVNTFENNPAGDCIIN